MTQAFAGSAGRADSPRRAPDNPPLGRGFASPVYDAQAAFRCALEALSQPGLIIEMPDLVSPPAGLHPASAALLLALADFDTPLWLADDLPEATRAWLRFHCGSPVAGDTAAALLAVIDGAAAAPVLSAFNVGTDQFPDRSATVFVQCAGFSGAQSVTLTGPGIETSRVVSVAGLRQGFWDEVGATAGLYPLGVDLVLVCGRQVIGLPRTVRIGRSG